MSEYTDQYRGRLIFQYWGKPNARAEIELLAGEFERAFEFFRDLPDAYDVDNAIGEQQDVIGRIIGFPRLVPYASPKVRFGFEENDNARGFADVFDSDRLSAPFFDQRERAYSDLELDDSAYRQFQKTVIARNNASAYVTGDEGISLQDAVETAFGVGSVWVNDSVDMAMTLYVGPNVDGETAKILRDNNLLPAPQGVRYRLLAQAEIDNTFGFHENAKGFADLFDSSRPGGVFARAIL